MRSGRRFRQTSFYLVMLSLSVGSILSTVTLRFTARLTARQQLEATVPADILLVDGSCIVNEAMLSGESTPLLKESVQLLDGSESLDVDETHKNTVLFSGTKILQSSNSS
jgi:high-affinity K+ transport system ATPase subunit B